MGVHAATAPPQRAQRASPKRPGSPCQSLHRRIPLRRSTVLRSVDDLCCHCYLPPRGWNTQRSHAAERQNAPHPVCVAARRSKGHSTQWRRSSRATRGRKRLELCPSAHLADHALLRNQIPCSAMGMGCSRSVATYSIARTFCGIAARSGWPRVCNATKYRDAKSGRQQMPSKCGTKHQRRPSGRSPVKKQRSATCVGLAGTCCVVAALPLARGRRACWSLGARGASGLPRQQEAEVV